MVKLPLITLTKQKQDIREKIEEKGKRLEEITSNLLGYHSFYGKFSIFLFFSSILFFIALSFGKKTLLNNMQLFYYVVAGMSSIVLFNLVKGGTIIRMKRRNKEEIIYVLDILQTITITLLLYSFVNVAVGNNIYSLFRSLLLVLTLFTLYLSYMSRRDILFKFIISLIYKTNVVVAKEHYKGSGRVIIMDQEIIDKINYYSSYLLFFWYLLSFSLTLIAHRFYSLRILLYFYFLPLILLVFIYSFIYSYFRKRAM